VEPQQAARGRVVDLRLPRSRVGGVSAPNPERLASAASIPTAPGSHDGWKKSPLVLSRTRGRPVPAETLPARSPQPSQLRTKRASATFSAPSRRIVCTVSMPATMVHIGERLKKQRTRRALTQAELADHAGVTTATVARIERDEIEPRMTTLRKLARALGVDPAELVE
jgi:DNA-binding XRE family transcriptional regulator